MANQINFILDHKWPSIQQDSNSNKTKNVMATFSSLDPNGILLPYPRMQKLCKEIKIRNQTY